MLTKTYSVVVAGSARFDVVAIMEDHVQTARLLATKNANSTG